MFLPRPRSTRPLALLALLAALAAASPARAAYSYSFDQSDYQVAAGATISVSVYLSETETSNLTTLGLIEGDVRLLFNEPTRISTPAQVLSRTAGPGFDSPASPQPDLVQATASTSGIADIIQSSFDPAKATANRILLGTFLFRAGSVAGAVTQLRATDQNGLTDGLLLADGTVLDAQAGPGTATITVLGTAAVPEPATWVMVGSALLIGGCVARARRRSA